MTGVTQTLLELVGLELYSGRLEDAATDLAELKEVFEDLTRPADPPTRNGLRQALRLLDQQKMILEGDYAGAGAELEGLAGKDIGLERLLAEVEKQKFNPTPHAVLGVGWPTLATLASQSPYDVLALHMGGYFQHQNYLSYRNLLAQKLQEDAQFFYRRGFLSLIEGDIPAAKERFRQTRRTPPPNWNLPTITHGPAESYLRMIEAAEKK